MTAHQPITPVLFGSNARPVQGSLIPDVSPDRPTGAIVGSVQSGSNADLIARLAPLYLTGSVLDCTYGRGRWWTKYRPAELITHDIELDGVDFRALPEDDRSVDAVCFDPPYIPQGGYATSTQQDFANRFGLTSRSRLDIWSFFDDGMAECARVTRRWVLAKCCDFVNGGQFCLGHLKMIDAGERAGLTVHDLIVHHGGAGPGGHNIFTPLRARRHHSYLIVFERRGAR